MNELMSGRINVWRKEWSCLLTTGSHDGEYFTNSGLSRDALDDFLLAEYDIDIFEDQRASLV